jgi:probable HAF family extracellular repeat protein
MKNKPGVVLITFLLILVTGAMTTRADISTSSITNYSPQPITTDTFDFVVEVTVAPNDGEFVDRFQITLPADWTIHSATAPPANTTAPCPGVSTQAVIMGQTVIWEIAGGYAGGSTCGPWMSGAAPGTAFHFVANVTIPDCSAAPLTLPWGLYGDNFGPAGPPHNIISNLTVTDCVVPAIASENSYRFKVIDHPDAATVGNGTVITGINDQGQVVGYYEDNDDTVHGFLYDGTTFGTVDYPGAVSTQLYGINNHGRIVGYFDDAAFITRGFSYDSGTYSAPVNYPGADSTFLLNINDNDHIAASYIDAGGWHGFHNIDGPSAEFNHPGSPPAGTYTILFDINNNDSLTGLYWDSGGRQLGFLSKNTVFSNISYPGANNSRATAINNNNVVAGYYEDTTGNTNGFIFDGVSIYSQINFPRSSETIIQAINNNGDIAGSFLDGSFTNHGFIARRFSWVPFYPAIIQEK